MNQRSRKINSIKNIIYGMVVIFINTITSFISRTFLIKILGVEYLGLNGLFSEVISVLSLAELGIGMAIIYNLYKPLYNKDEEKISQLMSFYRTAYHGIAVITFIIGIICVFIIDKLVTHVSFSLNYIRFVFFLFVIRTAGSYLFSYKQSLLNADQKQYIISVTRMFSSLLGTVVSVIILLISRNYILYLVLLIFQDVLTNLFLSAYIDIHYQFLNYKSKLNKKETQKIFSNVKNMFIKRISGIITNSTDNILISKLVGTVQVGYYSNYVVVFSVIRMIKTQLINGIAASIGELSVNGSENHSIDILKDLTYLFFCFASIVSCGLIAVCSLFVEIWLGKNYVIKNSIVFIIVINLFLEICCEPLWQYVEVSGLFDKDKNIGIIGSVINLISSIILGMKFGMLGIFIGTICSRIVQIFLKTELLFKGKYQRSGSIYYKMLVKMGISFGTMLLIQIFICKYIYITNIYILFIVKGIVALSVSVIFIILPFLNCKEFEFSSGLVKDCIKLVRNHMSLNKF